MGQYYSGPVLQWASITVGQCYSGPVLQWASITVGQYYSGPVLQWASITVGQYLQSFMRSSAFLDLDWKYIRPKIQIDFPVPIFKLYLQRIYDLIFYGNLKATERIFRHHLG